MDAFAEEDIPLTTEGLALLKEICRRYSIEILVKPSRPPGNQAAGQRRSRLDTPLSPTLTAVMESKAAADNAKAKAKATPTRPTKARDAPGSSGSKGGKSASATKRKAPLAVPAVYRVCCCC